MSESTSPYRSRIFNFLNQQTQRLTEKCQQAARHFKIATVWGIQAVVYSLQAIVQSVQQAGKQLKANPQEQNPKLSETKISQNEEILPTDHPIKKVIEAAREIPLQEDFVKKTLLSVTNPSEQNQNPIQAVASLRQTKTLVLIAAKNEILDILNHTQQQKLKQTILAETASYTRYRRQNETQKPQQNLPNPTQTQQLAPASPLNEIKTWLKTGPLGVSLNIIQDAVIIANPKNLLEQNQKPTTETNTYQTIKQLLLPPAKAAVENSIQAVQNFNLPTAQSLQTSLSQTSQTIVNQVKQIALDLVTDPIPAPIETPQTENSPIKTFLQNTLNYLSQETSESTSENSSKNLSKPAKTDKQKTPKIETNQTLLSFSNLFPNTPTLATANSNQITLNQNQTISNPNLEKIQVGETLQKIQQTTRKKSKKTNVLKTTKKQPNPTEKNKTIQTKQTNKVQHTPDWIEIKATSVGYVKHPLETLLGWIDKALLFLEEIILAILQWFKKK